MPLISFIKQNKTISPIHYAHKCNNNPLVSVCVTTYNHEKWIKECVLSILNQKTNFNYEIILGEDDSNDKTRQICISLANQYPNQIRLILHHRGNNITIKNKPSGRFNFFYNLKHAKGEFIALCDGDDKWIDTKKLQKQVDYLIANPNYSCHYMACKNYHSNKLTHQYFGQFDLFRTLKYGKHGATSTMMFRMNYIKKYDFVKIINKNIVADWPLEIICMLIGNGFSDKQLGAIHNEHKNNRIKLLSSNREDVYLYFFRNLFSLHELSIFKNFKIIFFSMYKKILWKRTKKFKFPSFLDYKNFLYYFMIK